MTASFGSQTNLLTVLACPEWRSIISITIQPITHTRVQMSTETQILLRRHDATRGLEPPYIDQLAQLAEPVGWQPGESVFHEGDRNGFLYLVIEGRIVLHVFVPGRGRVCFLTIGSNDLFGWSSVYYEKPKSAAATAVQASRALALDARQLRELSDSDCSFACWLTQLLLRVISDRLKATRLQLLDVFKG